ncbi:hypothetical protein FACS1894132_14380 [Clostridia bacterium]|nr:hypothetical protein FACS1894132_14380 [Clostridia bacterium]
MEYSFLIDISIDFQDFIKYLKAYSKLIFANVDKKDVVEFISRDGSFNIIHQR